MCLSVYRLSRSAPLFRFLPLEWTVTLAGTYQDDMAPDVQMHLSFPQRSSSQGKVMIKRQLCAASPQPMLEPTTQAISQNGNNHDDGYYFNEDIRTDMQPAIMPSQQTNQLNFNPRRTLSRHHYNSSGRLCPWKSHSTDGSAPLMFQCFVFFELQNRSENIPMRTATETIYGWKTTIFPMWIRIAKTQIESLQSKRRKKPSRYLTGLTICFSSHPNIHKNTNTKTNTCPKQ